MEGVSNKGSVRIWMLGYSERPKKTAHVLSQLRQLHPGYVISHDKMLVMTTQSFETVDTLSKLDEILLSWCINS